MYGRSELIEDAAGYGLVIFTAKSGTIDWTSKNWTAREPFLDLAASDTFLESRYALVKTTRELTIYRFYGVSPMAEARMLGAYWTPARPALRIDKLGYSTFHDQSRAELAIKRKWSPMSEIVDARLADGSWIFVGRAGLQVDQGVRLSGGAIQMILPGIGHELHLVRRHA